jgi:hypothetical protein
MSDVLVPFLYELRSRQLKVGTQEMVQLARAMLLGLHRSSLDGFYYLARALLVHRESDLDRFDEAFLAHFKGIRVEVRDLAAELAEWLKDPRVLETLTEEQKAALKELDAEELLRMFEERLREQKGRHEGGNRWIGTGGTSPFGTGGQHPTGMSLRAGSQGRGGRGAIGMADARRYRPYRSDLVLDVRQIEVALRKLRQFVREGIEEELDVEASIDATARNFGELEVVLRPPKKTNVRVLLLMDVGGSMDPFAQTCSQLFSAARRASNFRELRAYYFHNTVYGRVFKTEGLMDPVELPDLFEQVHARWKLIVVGDAAMAPGELLGTGPWGSPLGLRRPDGNLPTGLDWLVLLATRFEKSVWLNPDPPQYWEGGTCRVIREVFPMHPLTLDGLSEAVAYLSKGPPRSSRLPSASSIREVW